MIAVVAAWPIVIGPAAEAHHASKTKRAHNISTAAGPVSGARHASKTKPPRSIAAQVKALIRKNAKNTEIVSFADRRQHPVKVVRGKQEPAASTAPRNTGEIVTFADKRMKPVLIMRGGPVVATVSMAPPAESPKSSREPIGAYTQIVSFASRRDRPVTVLRGGAVVQVALDPPAEVGSPYLDLFHAARGADLDRVAFAVDGAESSHGADSAMWRPLTQRTARADAGVGGRSDRFRWRRSVRFDAEPAAWPYVSRAALPALWQLAGRGRGL